MKIQFMEGDALVAELDLPVMPRSGEPVTFRAKDDVLSKYRVRNIGYLFDDPNDPPNVAAPPTAIASVERLA